LNKSTPVFIALGSNLGDRRGHLDWAVEQLGRRLSGLRLSRITESAPVDVPDVQPDYLNAVATGQTSMTPRELLEWLLTLETERGRVRQARRSARTLDLDLIFYGSEAIDEPGLLVPHPRFRERRFVLEPLAELAPDFVDPVTGKTMEELAGLRR
jgi:2-amino-4-hydroxy-6-hydroxymethyldihydropteridine diphosphokinase